MVVWVADVVLAEAADTVARAMPPARLSVAAAASKRVISRIVGSSSRIAAARRRSFLLVAGWVPACWLTLCRGGSTAVALH